MSTIETNRRFSQFSQEKKILDRQQINCSTPNFYNFPSRRHKHGISWYQTPKNYVVWLPNSQNSSMTKLKNGQLNPNKEHTENYWCVLQGSRNSKINIILNCNHRRSSGIPSMKSTAQIHHRLPGNRTAQSKIEDYTEWSKYPVQMKRNMRQYARRGHIGFHD